MLKSKKFQKKPKANKLIGYIQRYKSITLILLPIFWFIFEYSRSYYYENKSINEYLISYGIVDNLDYRDRPTIIFNVKDKIFKAKFKYSIDKLKLNDSIKIRYYKTNPTFFWVYFSNNDSTFFSTY